MRRVEWCLFWVVAGKRGEVLYKEALGDRGATRWSKREVEAGLESC